MKTRRLAVNPAFLRRTVQILNAQYLLAKQECHLMADGYQYIQDYEVQLRFWQQHLNAAANANAFNIEILTGDNRGKRFKVVPYAGGGCVLFDDFINPNCYAHTHFSVGTYKRVKVLVTAPMRAAAIAKTRKVLEAVTGSEGRTEALD